MSPSRGERDVARTSFHIKLTKAERAKLVALSHRRKASAAEVMRDLLAKAK